MYTFNRKEFENYLKQVRKLSVSSISKYASQAHNRILKDFGISFYEINDMEQLHELLKDVKLLEKNMAKDPKRMYSAAVSNYIKFIAYKLEDSYIMMDPEYNSDVEQALQMNNVDKVSHYEPTPLVQESRLIYRRSATVAAEAIKRSHYECLVNSKHAYFISRTTRQNYVEAHHIIPISTQALFSQGIDCVPNIASLCPVCHRQIHHGLDHDKKDLLEILWDKNYRKIEDVGIELSFKELVELY